MSGFISRPVYFVSGSSIGSPRCGDNIFSGYKPIRETCVKNGGLEMTETKKCWITPKSVINFLIAGAVMAVYYYFIDIGLMKAQGLDFLYLWHSGGGQ